MIGSYLVMNPLSNAFMLLYGQTGDDCLVGEDEKVECPECGTDCSGARGMRTHFDHSDECQNAYDQKSYALYLSENQIYKRMARETFGMIVLVGEDEEVDCPECHWSGKGRQAFLTHVKGSHGGLDDSSDPPCQFFSPRDIHKKIATQWLGDESKYKTVQKLVKVGRLQLTECSDKLSGHFLFLSKSMKLENTENFSATFLSPIMTHNMTLDAA